MPVEVRIEDNELVGFSVQARDHLKTSILSYSAELVAEANRIEAGRNRTSGTPEVTQGMVNDASTLLRHGVGSPKKNLWDRGVRIISAILSLLVGISYDNEKLREPTYMVFFIVLVALAILFVILATLKE